MQTCNCVIQPFPDGLVVRIWRSHRQGRGSIPRLGKYFLRHFFYITLLESYFWEQIFVIGIFLLVFLFYFNNILLVCQAM